MSPYLLERDLKYWSLFCRWPIMVLYGIRGPTSFVVELGYYIGVVWDPCCRATRLNSDTGGLTPWGP